MDELTSPESLASSELTEGPIIQAFQQQVAGRGGSPAVRSPAGQVTYRELDAAANGFAHAICDAAGEETDPVAVLLDQGLWSIAAILGVLKAGLAFAPVDISQPPARMGQILGDTQARVVVTDSAHLDLVRGHAPAGARIVVCSDTTARPDPPADRVTAPDDLAYILYTSGSTGRPRGVMQTHRNVVGWAVQRAADLGLRPDDRLSLVSSYTTGAGMADVFGALLIGATLCPFDLRGAGIAALADWLSREQISVLHTVPTVIRHLARAMGSDAQFANVRVARLGGETVTRRDVELCRRLFPAHELVVVSYGATECSIITRQLLPPAVPLSDTLVPVGTPPPGMALAIRGDDGRGCEPNETGEIIVLGEMISSGYWRDPEATARVLRCDPDEPRRRSYATGDVGYLRNDGRLVHVGRKDSVLKVRGHRVSAAEVEAALMSLESVQEAAVSTRSDEEGNARLVAHFVPSGLSVTDAAALRSALAGAVPDYMIPSTLIALEALPLLPGGKVDRKALASTAPGSAEPDRPAAAPRTPLEAELVRVWQDVLALACVSVTDDFFELGGDSLGATAMMARVEALTGRRLPLHTLMHAPTIEALARVLSDAMGTSPGTVRPVLDGTWAFNEAGAMPPCFWVPAGIGRDADIFVAAGLAKALGRDWPVYILAVQHEVTGRYDFPSVDALAADLVRRIRRVQPRGPYLLGGLCVGGIAALEVARQLIAQGEPVASLMLWDTRCPGTSAGAGDSRSQRIVPRAVRNLRELHAIPRGQRFAHFVGKARGAITRLVRSRAWKTYMAMIRRHRPAPYPALLTVLASEDLYALDPTLGWGAIATGGLEVVPVSGDHATSIRMHVGAMAKMITERFMRGLESCAGASVGSGERAQAPGP